MSRLYLKFRKNYANNATIKTHNRMIMSNIPLPLANNLQNNKATIIKQHHKRTDLLKIQSTPTNRDKREQKHLFINKVKFIDSKQKSQVISHRF